MLLINTQQFNVLKKALLFLKMAELREACIKLCLPKQGTKNVLIARILHFIKTGEIIKEPKIPDASKAKRGCNYLLHPKTLILKGAYKNDLKTRLFFKTLIGEYFHFTAFGIDWLNARWLEGKPPTYQEFANMWKSEYAKRKEEGSTPKEEWAYINFTQQFINAHPDASRELILNAWEIERNKNVQIVNDILQLALKE